MKIQVMPQDLVRHINRCQRAISARTSMPILECIKFEAFSNQLTLTATDLELTIRSRMECNIEEEGYMVVPSNMIGNIFRKLPQSPALIEEKDGLLTIRCFDSYFELQLPNPSEFPPVPDVDSIAKSVFKNELLKRAVNETEFAASVDESKIAITGIYYERKDDKANFVSLDGYRVAVSRIGLEDGNKNLDESMIIPRRAMIELSKLLEDGETTSLSSIPGHVLFESGSFELYSRLIDKKYINYKEIISDEYKCKIKIERRPFQQAVERASLLTQAERAHLIKFNISTNEMEIESNSEIGHVNERLAIEKEGEDLIIAFNARYILDGLRALESERLVLYLNGSLNPMLIRPAEDEEAYLYLVLPVRIAGE